jgi:hypothetical protein
MRCTVILHVVIHVIASDMETTMLKSNYYYVATPPSTWRRKTKRYASRTQTRQRKEQTSETERENRTQFKSSFFPKWKSVVLITRKFSKRLSLPPVVPASHALVVRIVYHTRRNLSLQLRRRRCLSFARARSRQGGVRLSGPKFRSYEVYYIDLPISRHCYIIIYIVINPSDPKTNIIRPVHARTMCAY